MGVGENDLRVPGPRREHFSGIPDYSELYIFFNREGLYRTSRNPIGLPSLPPKKITRVPEQNILISLTTHRVFLSFLSHGELYIFNREGVYRTSRNPISLPSLPPKKINRVPEQTISVVPLTTHRVFLSFLSHGELYIFNREGVYRTSRNPISLPSLPPKKINRVLDQTISVVPLATHRVFLSFLSHGERSVG